MYLDIPSAPAKKKRSHLWSFFLLFICYSLNMSINVLADIQTQAEDGGNLLISGLALFVFILAAAIIIYGVKYFKKKINHPKTNRIRKK
jgi:hypothetical protein